MRFDVGGDTKTRFDVGGDTKMRFDVGGNTNIGRGHQQKAVRTPTRA